MSLDYSKVIMVGTGWATRNPDGSFNRFATALEAAGGEPAVSEDPEPKLFDVFKLTDGQRGKRASAANLTLDEAEQYVSDRPDDEFEIAPA